MLYKNGATVDSIAASYGKSADQINVNTNNLQKLRKSERFQNKLAMDVKLAAGVKSGMYDKKFAFQNAKLSYPDLVTDADAETYFTNIETDLAQAERIKREQIEKEGRTETRDVRKEGRTEARDVRKEGRAESKDVRKEGRTEARDVRKEGRAEESTIRKETRDQASDIYEELRTEESTIRTESRAEDAEIRTEDRASVRRTREQEEKDARLMVDDPLVALDGRELRYSDLTASAKDYYIVHKGDMEGYTGKATNEGSTGAERTVNRTREDLGKVRQFEDDMAIKYQGEGGVYNQETYDMLNPQEKLQYRRMVENVNVGASTRTVYGSNIKMDKSIEVTQAKSDIAGEATMEGTKVKNAQAKLDNINPGKDSSTYDGVNSLIDRLEQGGKTGLVDQVMNGVIGRYFGTIASGDTGVTVKDIEDFGKLNEYQKTLMLNIAQKMKPVSEGNIALAEKLSNMGPQFSEENNISSLKLLKKTLLGDSVDAVNSATDAGLTFGKEGDYRNSYRWYDRPDIKEDFPEYFKSDDNSTDNSTAAPQPKVSDTDLADSGFQL